MFQKQISFVPILLFWVGLFISIYFFGVILYLSYYLITELPDKVTLANIGLPGVFQFLIMVLGFLFFSWFGVILMDLFPAIQVGETGLFVKNVFTIDHFTWDELRTITNARRFKDTKAVILDLQGNRILNFIRYYPYFMHGILAGALFDPVVLLSGGLNHRDEIQKEIGQQIRKKITSQTSLSLKV